MKNIDRLPKFMPGQVIDLTYKHKGLPNRLLVKSVFIREQDNDWMYDVYLENIGDYTVLDENFITTNMTNKSAPVYKCSQIIKMYNDGWRYCGSFKKNSAHSVASKYATNKYIKDIILRPTLNASGCLVNDSYSMWIRYNNIINDDGTIIKNEAVDRDTIVIK